MSGMRPRDWTQLFSLMKSLGETQERGAPMMGEEVLRDGRRYVCTSILADGRVGYTPIPEGLTTQDLGRKFQADATLWETF